MTNNDDANSVREWVKTARNHEYHHLLLSALDVVEPVAPFVAQLLWVAQPMAGVFGGRQLIHDLAEALDSPDELAALRRELGDE